MKKVYFAIAIHFHQPVGNFQHVFDMAYEKCYLPFIDLLSDSPDIKMSLHFSGCLFDYLQANHADFISKLRGLLKRGQIEIMGGGYYEPIFPIIPKKDALGQLGLMKDYLKEKFNVFPQGLWVPERVWSPELAGLFQDAGFKYTILDDIHFINSGVARDKLHGYYVAKHDKAGLAVFPSAKKLRYDIPFKPVEETIEYFEKEFKDIETPLFVYADDAEKFGVWPGTNDHVYKNGWLKKFFEKLKETPFIELLTPSEYLKMKPPLGEIEIPECSYEEMLEWSGGNFKNFLVKYPESGHMHKKMLYVSKKLAKVKDKEAKRELYKGQCNCAYWHGLFGGIYLYHLRKAAYEHLINAEKRADVSCGKSAPAGYSVIENKTFSVYMDKANGEIIRELDHKPSSTNLVNTFASRIEPYHKKMKNLPTSYDKHIRACLVDNPNPFAIRKEIKLNGSEGIEIFYTLKNSAKDIVKAVFGIEFNVTMPYANSERYSYESGGANLGDLNKTGETGDTNSFSIKDSTKELEMDFKFSLAPERIVYSPIKTVSQSEKGFELNYQGSSILPKWNLEVNAGKEIKFSIKWRVIWISKRS